MHSTEYFSVLWELNLHLRSFATLCVNKTVAKYLNSIFTAPDMVDVFHVKNVSDDATEKRLLLSWDRPLVAKGIIRQYVISIEAEGTCTEQITLMCADCNSDAPNKCEVN